MAKKDGLFKKFCLEGSLLGFKYLYLYPDLLSRCFWVCNMVLTSAFAFILSLMLYWRFVGMPTRITIENQYEAVRNLPYPSVSLCSPNQFTISAVQHFDRTFVDGNRSLDLEYAFRQLIGFYRIMKIDQEAMAELQQLIDANRYTVLQVMASLPQSCERFLKLCIFRRRKYPGCKGLFRTILTQHGMCCIFNNPYYFGNRWRNEQQQGYVYKEVVIAGLADGLNIVTDLEPQTALDGTLLNGGSTMVIFNNWDEFPADDHSYLVSPNTESFHPIHATHTYCSKDVQELPVESRKCLFDSERQLQYFRNYHNSDCDTLCFAKAIEQVCHCLLIYLPNVRISMTCNVTSIACAMNVKQRMLNDCDCPRDCNSREYRVHVTIGNLDGLPYLVKDLYPGIVFNKSTSVMHIFFPVPVYVKQKQETVMSLTTLISNLGGVFGLCIGCSFTGALEIVFYLYMAIRNFLSCRLERFKKRQAVQKFIH